MNDIRLIFLLVLMVAAMACICFELHRLSREQEYLEALMLDCRCCCPDAPQITRYRVTLPVPREGEVH